MRTVLRSLLALTALVIGASAWATGARNAALNLDRWRMLDSTSIQLTPSDMLSFKKIVYGELGTGTGAGDDYAAAFLPLGPGVLGVYAGAIPATGAVTLLGMADDQTGDSTVDSPLYGTVPAANVPQYALITSNNVYGRIRVLYGMELANSLRLAGGVSYYSRTNMDDSFHSQSTLLLPADFGTTKLTDTSSVINIHAGADMPLGPLNPIAVGIEVGLPSFEATALPPDGHGNSFKSKSGMDLGVNVRARIPNTVGKDMDTMAFASFGTGTLEGTSVSRAFVAAPLPGFFTTYEDGTMTAEQGHITIGASNNHRLGEGTVAFYSLSYENTTSSMKVEDTRVPTMQTTTTKSTTNDLPIVIGIESRLAKWLVVRFSSKSSIMTVTTTDYSLKGGPQYLPGGSTGADNVDQMVVDDNSSQTFALGLTLDVSERLSIEGVLSEALLFNGPNFVGGLSPSVFGRVSLIARI